MAAPVVWFEIAGRDLDVLTRFYGDLLGWKVDADNPQRYGMVDTGAEGGIPGGIYAPGDQVGEYVSFYAGTAASRVVSMPPATRSASTCRSMRASRGSRATWSGPSDWAPGWCSHPRRSRRRPGWPCCWIPRGTGSGCSSRPERPGSCAPGDVARSWWRVTGT